MLHHIRGYCFVRPWHQTRTPAALTLKEGILPVEIGIKPNGKSIHILPFNHITGSNLYVYSGVIIHIGHHVNSRIVIRQFHQCFVCWGLSKFRVGSDRRLLPRSSMASSFQSPSIFTGREFLRQGQISPAHQTQKGNKSRTKRKTGRNLNS